MDTCSKIQPAFSLEVYIKRILSIVITTHHREVITETKACSCVKGTYSQETIQ